MLSHYIIPYLSSMKWLCFLLVVLTSCSGTDALDSTVKTYFDVYQKHTDFEEYMSFYADSAVLDDVMLKFKREGKDSIYTFLDWNNPNLKILGDIALTYEQPIIQDDKAVVNGVFTRFSWQGEVVDSMRFSTILTFNSDLKIIHHEDWIDYPREWL